MVLGASTWRSRASSITSGEDAFGSFGQKVVAGEASTIAASRTHRFAVGGRKPGGCRWELARRVDEGVLHRVTLRHAPEAREGDCRSCWAGGRPDGNALNESVHGFVETVTMPCRQSASKVAVSANFIELFAHTRCCIPDRTEQLPVLHTIEELRIDDIRVKNRSGRQPRVQRTKC